jgi:hypothetical protein
MAGPAAHPAFQVVTRALVFELTKVLKGLAKMYCDDAMGSCDKADLTRDMEAAKKVFRSLLGEEAVEVLKDEDGKALVHMGYLFDLDTRRVSISARNRSSALYAFMCIDLSKKVPVHILERIASLASRYAPLCRTLIPFCRTLYANYHGFKSHNAHVTLTKRVAILLWRVVLCAQSLQGSFHFTRLFESFRWRFRSLPY